MIRQNKSSILLIDDDPAVLSSIGLLLKQAGYRVLKSDTPEQALQQLTSEQVDCVIQDMNFSRRTDGEEGFVLLSTILEQQADLPVILITAWASVSMAVQGIKAGAADFITKPWSHEQVLQSVSTALGLRRFRRSVESVQKPDRRLLDRDFDFSAVIGEHPSLLEVLDIVSKTADTEASVLITGESGTGKEVIADAIHRNSARRDAPFVKVNLGGISGSLFESELFGHVRGAFTDAKADRQGRFEGAQGGTIFLDEIGDLDPSCQVKLLRVLQDRRFEKLGSSKSMAMDVRVISATNRDLTRDIREGRFREDLFFRLNLIPLRMPSLRERPGDLALLCHHFLEEVARRYDRNTPSLDPDALSWLRKHSWPGNVRQLRQTLERTFLIESQNCISARGLHRAESMMPLDHSTTVDGAESTLEEMEERMIRLALKRLDNNLSHVARELGITRSSLYRRLEKYGIGH